MAEKIKIDARGEQCPIPVVKAKKAMEQAHPGDMIEVYVDNEIAVQNLTKLAGSQACASNAKKQSEKEFIVTIEVAGESDTNHDPMPQPQPQPEITCVPENRNRDIVVVSSASMGNGDEQLGKILLKGFFYALSQNDVLPAKILFYNSGIFVTTEESEIIKDLKRMEDQGTVILSCGTCLDFYNRKERLLVGEIGNMYDIVEAMINAGKIIRP